MINQISPMRWYNRYTNSMSAQGAGVYDRASAVVAGSSVELIDRPEPFAACPRGDMDQESAFRSDLARRADAGAAIP